jgi:Terminase small subunit
MDERMDAKNSVLCAREVHEAFAQAFAVHGNAVAAYKAAYPEAGARTAKSNAHKVANHPDVQRRVLELQAARRKQLLEETADLEALVANLALGKAAEMFDEEGRLLPIRELPIEVKNALKSMKIRERTQPDGTVVRTFEYELPDPLAAARLLAQLRGALVERHDLTSAGRSIAPPVDSAAVPELRARLLPADVVEAELVPEPAPDDGSDLV